MWKTSTSNSHFIKWTHHSSLACTHGGQDKKKSLREPFSEVRRWPLKLSNEQFTTRIFFCKVPYLVYRPTVVAVAGGDCRQMWTSYTKSDTTLQQSFTTGSRQRSINMSQWGLNIIYFISSIQDGVFLKRAGLVLTIYMLEIVVIVTPTLPSHTCYSFYE